MIQDPDNPGNHILRQQGISQPTVWVNMGDPSTVVGNFYQNYRTTVAARFPTAELVEGEVMPPNNATNYLALCGRLGQPSPGFGLDLVGFAQCLLVFRSGLWRFEVNGQTAASGQRAVLAPGEWLTLGLSYSLDTVHGSLDGKQIFTHTLPTGVPKGPFSKTGFLLRSASDHGLVALRSGRHLADFENFTLAAVTPHPVPPPRGLVAHSVYHGDHRRNDLDGQVGAILTVPGPHSVRVTAIGRYRCAGSTGQHTLSLYRADQEATVLVANVTVAMGRGATVDAAGFVYGRVSARLERGGRYYLVSNESKGGDCWYGRYTDACGGNSGGLPLAFSDVKGEVQMAGGVYRVAGGAWVEDVADQWAKESRRMWGPVNARYSLARL